MLGKMEFSVGKVLKNHFSKKFHGISAESDFPRKNVRKIGPWIQSYDFRIFSYNASVVVG
jgi:hypothetical protein